MNFRSYLKNRILAQSQDRTEFQSADILKYFKDLKRGPNTEIVRLRRIGQKTFLRWLLGIKKEGLPPLFLSRFLAGLIHWMIEIRLL